MNQPEGRPRKIQLTALNKITEKVTRPMPAVTANTEVVGKIDRRVFWPVLAAGFLLMSTMVWMISDHLLAMAATFPIPFTITSDKVDAKNFKLYPGLTPDTHEPVAVIQMDANITNQVITKSLTIPGIGTVTAKLSAGQSTPVVIKGLTLDATSIKADQAHFTNLTLTAGGMGFDQTADSQVLTNATIDSPYLLANDISLPGLSLTITVH